MNKTKTLLQEIADQTARIERRKTRKPDVVITCIGGVVDLSFVSPGIIVSIRDYDIDGLEATLYKDSHGNEYRECGNVTAQRWINHPWNQWDGSLPKQCPRCGMTETDALEKSCVPSR